LKRARAVEDDELLRILHRQQPEQELIGERENRRVRADAERERQDDDEGECRRLRSVRTANRGSCARWVIGFEYFLIARRAVNEDLRSESDTSQTPV
jgi:hypothetical protein